MDKFSEFMNQIPVKAMQGVERRFSNNVGQFKPRSYVSGVLMHSSDYHIIVPSVTPPNTYINDRLVYMEPGKFVAFNPGDSVLCAESRPTRQYLTLLIKPELVNKIAEEMDITGEVRFTRPQYGFYSANISIEDICDEINISPFQYIRVFKHKTGLSPKIG